MTDHSHLMALISGLGTERARLAAAATVGERELRKVWVAQIEREIAAEEAFLGLAPQVDMSDDDILSELFA